MRRTLFQQRHLRITASVKRLSAVRQFPKPLIHTRRISTTSIPRFTVSDAENMSKIQHSEACCTLPPFTGSDYKPTGSIQRIQGQSLPHTAYQSQLTSS